MFTTRQSAEEELALAELALADLVDSTPTADSCTQVQIEADYVAEMAQLTIRCNAILQATYVTHRAALVELKGKHAHEIGILQQEHRNAKAGLTAHHAEKKRDALSAISLEKAAFAAKLATAKRRLKNAERVLNQLTRAGGR